MSRISCLFGLSIWNDHANAFRFMDVLASVLSVISDYQYNAMHIYTGIYISIMGSVIGVLVGFSKM